jgi:hypothetical protein
MTKKNYVAIGKVLHNQLEEYEHNADYRAVIMDAAVALADIFSKDNSLFNRERFLHFVATGKDIHNSK